eukprot:INCI13964.3.p1 GENE.INCI13964.3~~INCI13964.3.p1  ORF type:complete len:518 (+),score=118.34 INCI13964.3:126-1679(+)
MATTPADAAAAAQKQLADLKAQLQEKTTIIRRLKEENAPFMHVVKEIESIKAEIKALSGKKGKKSKQQQQQGKKGGKQQQKQSKSKDESAASSPSSKKGSGGQKKKGSKGSDGAKGGAASDKKSGHGAGAQTQHASVQTTNQVVGIFSHLKKDNRAKKLATTFSRDEKIHPEVIKMGLKFSQGTLDSVNSRTVGMLSALKSFIADVDIDATTVFSLELGKLITVQINHLVTSRRHTLAMGNVINWLKSNISLLPSTLSHEQAKAKLCESIDYFIEERIDVAGAVIVDTALGKIQDGDVILTVSRYHVVEKILMRLTEYVRSAENRLNIRIVVTDSPPSFLGKRMIKKIASAGIHCTYAPLSALSYVMQDVTKVFIGASALASNGAVIAHAGTALVAMVAKTQGIPVLVCAETYKFCERVQVDAIVENELSDVDQLVFDPDADSGDSHDVQRDAMAEKYTAQHGALASTYCEPSALGLIYDLTPAEFVTALVTEVGIIPPTSVPVIIRETKDRQSVAS